MKLRCVLLFTCWFASNLYGQSPSVATHFISHDKTKIYFEVYGNGEPVILVHGFANNLESWKKKTVFTDLIANGFQVVLIDLRGNGKSGKPHEEQAYLNDAEAKDIMRLADTLQLSQYSIVGYSRGAIITSRVLVQDQRITKAVLGGMGDHFINPQWPRRIMFYEVLAGKRVDPQLDGFLKYIHDTQQDRQALALMQLGQPSTSREELANIDQPVLVVCGSDDNDNGSAETLASLVPTSEFVAVPGTHNNASQSKEFSKAIVDFLLPK